MLNTGYPPNTWDMRAGEQRDLKQDANFIGAGSIFLTLFMQFTFTIILVPFIIFGIIPAENLEDSYLGLGNTGYLLLYGVVYTICMGVPFLLTAALFRKRTNPFAPHERVKVTTLIPALLAGISMCVVANFAASSLMSFFQAFGIEPPTMPQMMEHTPLSLVLNIVIVAVLPGILEEMVFRGYILQTLRRYGDGMAILISSLFFSLMHGNLLQIPFAFMVGLVLGFIVVQTNNIWVAITLHFLNNLMATVLEYVTMGMSAEESNRIIIVFYLIVGAVGLLSLIIAQLAKSSLFHALKPSPSSLTVKERQGAFFTSPLTIIAIVLFILVTLLNTSLTGAG